MSYNALYNVDLSDEQGYPKVQLNDVDTRYTTVANDNISSNEKHRLNVPSGVKYVNLELDCFVEKDNTISVSNTDKIDNDKCSEIQHVAAVSKNMNETFGTKMTANTNNAVEILGPSDVQDVENTYSGVNRNKSRDTENNVGRPKHFQVEASGDMYAMVSK